MPAKRPASNCMEIRRAQPLLGTLVDIHVRNANPAAVDRAFARIAHVQRLMSFHDADSDLSRINLGAHRAPVTVHASTYRVLRLALALYHLTQHRFNPAVGRELVRMQCLPDHGFDARATLDFAALMLLPDNRVFCRQPLVISLDGIAKGYAVDCAVHALQAAGAAAGRVNAGGDLRVFGKPGQAVHVRDIDGAVHTLGSLKSGAVATSRIATSGDEAYPAVLCYAAHAAPQHRGAVTVLAKTAWLADALTKVAAIAPAQLARFGATSRYLPGAHPKETPCTSTRAASLA
mgnify:CR=1 FL=1